MPRLGRTKGHYSCDFCRVRKLRCSRPLPCINCVSRGKTCVLGTDGAGIAPSHDAGYDAQNNAVLGAGTAVPPNYQPPQAPPSDLLGEVQRLKQLAEDLERRLASDETRATTSQGHAHGHARGHGPAHGATTARSANTAVPYSPASTQAVSVVTPAQTPPDHLGHICTVVTHLDRVSMGKGLYVMPQARNSNADLLFKVERILAIPSAPEFTYNVVDDRLRAPTRCIYLPEFSEAMVLADTFLNSVSYLHHIVHHPSLHGQIRGIYDHIEQGEPIPLGEALLLLAIVATGTYLYSPPNDRHDGIFISRAEGTRQTPLWIQASLHVLDAVLRGPAPPSLVAIQGIITLSFLISNVEGVAFRYRQLINNGLLLGRELGLHCIDLEASTLTSTWTPIERELGRRVWWYMASTDWLLAERYGGGGVGVYQVHPHLMRVNEPRNIDDVDLTVDGGEPANRPLNQATDMSYFLQRIRLAKIARGIVDRMPMISRPYASVGMPGFSPHLDTVSDAELDAMLREMPSFFRLDTYDEENLNVPDDKFIPAYMIHSNIHTQRCKLHLSYLASWRHETCCPNGPATTTVPHACAPAAPVSSSSSASALPSASETSRRICIEAARQIIRAGTQLKRRSGSHPIVKSRLSCILYGIFLASIVLMIDLCVVSPQGNDSERKEDFLKQHGEVVEALRIVANASSQSPAAAELYSTLMQFVAKHRPQLLSNGVFQLPPATPAALEQKPGVRDATAVEPSVAPVASFGVEDMSLDNPLSFNFEGLDNINSYQWDDFLSTVDSSMFPEFIG